MADPIMGEVRAVAFEYAPVGWLLCNGQILNVSEYQALYTLLGNAYGGKGPDTFALPDLQGRSVIGAGIGAGLPSTTLGEKVGAATFDLPLSPVLIHGQKAAANVPAGSGIAHNAGSAATIPTQSPAVGLNYIISVYGNYPMRG